MERKTYKTGNPALKEGVFDKYKEQAGVAATPDGRVLSAGDSMTLQGTVNKSFLLLFITMLTGAITWHYVFQPTGAVAVMPVAIGGVLVALVVGLVIIFNNHLAPALSPFYAAFEGLALGCISAYYEAKYPGLVVQSVGLTTCVFLALLFAYTSRLIKATENFKLGVVAATGGICILYLINLVCILAFHMPIKPIYDAGPVGICLSLFVVTIAALNLVLDFDFIESGVEARAPKFMEWYGAFGLLVTLIWLYLEVLRLLAKLRNR